MAYDPNSQDPTKNIFAYGGNTIDAATGIATPVAPSINSSNIAPAAPIPYNSPNPVPLPNVAGLNPPPSTADSPTPQLTPTAPEQQATDMISRIKALNDQYTGQSAYRSQQEAAQGIPALTKTQNDLQSQLKTIQNEALAIPLQLQQEATGRGITTGGLQPIQTARLRTNAIQALSVNSLLEASRGNLATAQNMVDRAVAAKYDPIKEEIDAATKNLDLILKSPEYTLAEKNRAQAQKDIQDAKARAIEKQEANEKIAQAMAAAAIKNNPNNTAALLAAQSLLKLDSAKPDYLQQAFSLVGKFQSDPNETQKALLDLEAQRADISYKQSQTAVNWANEKKISSGSDDVPTVKNINGSDMQWNPKTKEWQTIGSGSSPSLGKTQDQLNFLQTTADQALQLAGASGRSGGRKMVEGFLVGSTDYTKLESVANTLKVNVLALMTDPNIKKFFGPQMSNADVTLMTAAGTTLNPELNDPSQMTTEINRLKDLFLRMKNSLSGASTQTVLMVGPDNIEYNVPANQVDAFIKEGGKKK